MSAADRHAAALRRYVRTRFIVSSVLAAVMLAGAFLLERFA